MQKKRKKCKSSISFKIILKKCVGSVWFALQNRNYFHLAVYDGAYSPRTKPVRTSCQDTHHFNV